jgi:hypothetical protein
MFGCTQFKLDSNPLKAFNKLKIWYKKNLENFYQAEFVEGITYSQDLVNNEPNQNKFFYFPTQEKNFLYLLKRGKQTIFTDSPISGDEIIYRLAETIETLHQCYSSNEYRAIAKRSCLQTSPVEPYPKLTKINFNMCFSGNWDSHEIAEAWIIYKNLGEILTSIFNIRQGDELFYYATYSFPTENIVGDWELVTQEEFYNSFAQVQPEKNIGEPFHHSYHEEDEKLLLEQNYFKF